MPKTYYLPDGDEARATWLNNFAAKLPSLAGKYNITGTEIAETTTSAAYFDALIKYRNQVTEFSASLTAYKNAVRDGLPAGSTLNVFPVLPNNTLPAVPPFDIFGRVQALANRIKTSFQYSDVDGQNLGIEGAEDTEASLADLQPVLKVQYGNGGQPELNWVKNGMDALELQVNRGSAWEALTIHSSNSYTDTHPLPATGQIQNWSYRGIYRRHNERAGQWSTVVSIALSGM